MFLTVGWAIYLQVIVWIVKLITEYTDTSGGEGWVSACHHCRIVPDDEDPKSLAEVTHHLIPQYRSYYTLGRGACWLRPAVPKV